MLVEDIIDIEKKNSLIYYREEFEAIVIYNILGKEEKGKIDTLINFFKNGAGLDLISKAVGMSIEEVKSILIGRGFEV